ncbi:MAG: glycosyltransferase [Chloroflexi bacterium]|nr:glycosyltransferase [Chloroflexota bacterium]
MLVSIVVPTRNEEKDIARTLDALTSLSYPRKEILVVDDSTDGTPRVVASYADRGVRLVPGQGRGRCAARNVGVELACGDVVVILNGDVLLPQDFLERIVHHYQQGADYVLVWPTVANPESLYARYIEATQEQAYRKADWIEWTEGFSCRRDCAIAVGLFPDLPFAVVSGEDGYFGIKLREHGYKKVIDRSIIVHHVAPSRWREFWRQRVERGMPLAKVYLDGYRGSRLAAWLLGRTGLHAGQVLTVVPLLWQGFQFARYSPAGLKDTLPFTWLVGVEKAALVAGTWSGVLSLRRRSRLHSPETPPKPLHSRDGEDGGTKRSQGGR